MIIEGYTKKKLEEEGFLVPETAFAPLNDGCSIVFTTIMLPREKEVQAIIDAGGGSVSFWIDPDKKEVISYQSLPWQGPPYSLTHWNDKLHRVSRAIKKRLFGPTLTVLRDAKKNEVILDQWNEEEDSFGNIIGYQCLSLDWHKGSPRIKWYRQNPPGQGYCFLSCWMYWLGLPMNTLRSVVLDPDNYRKYLVHCNQWRYEEVPNCPDGW